VTRRLPPSTTAYLEHRARIVVNPNDRPLSKRELIEQIRSCDGAITMLTDMIDDEVMGAAPRLKVIANYAAGYNNIDLIAARERAIVVTNTPDVLTDATADLTWALILGVRRRIGEADRLVRAGAWTGWAPTQLLGQQVSGSVLGIVGMGRIGRAVARRAAAFNMRVIYTSRHEPVDIDKAWRRMALDELLRSADVISLHVPLTADTRGLVGAKELATMKPSASLINTSRGAVVDEEALADALRRGVIASAGLDVYAQEPDIHPALLASEHALLLPHVGSATLETRERMGRLAVDNVLAVLAGEPAPTPVP